MEVPTDKWDDDDETRRDVVVRETRKEPLRYASMLRFPVTLLGLSLDSCFLVHCFCYASLSFLALLGLLPLEKRQNPQEQFWGRFRWRKGQRHKTRTREGAHTHTQGERKPRCKRCECRDVGGRWQQVVATGIARAKDRQARLGSVGAATTRSVLSKHLPALAQFSHSL